MSPLSHFLFSCFQGETEASPFFQKLRTASVFCYYFQTVFQRPMSCEVLLTSVGLVHRVSVLNVWTARHHTKQVQSGYVTLCPWNGTPSVIGRGSFFPDTVYMHRDSPRLSEKRKLEQSQRSTPNSSVLGTRSVFIHLIYAPGSNIARSDVDFEEVRKSPVLALESADHHSK